MRPVLLIGHDANETFGLAPEGLGNRGLEILEHRALTGARLPEIEAVSGIVMFGGEMNVDETSRYPNLADERAYVRSALNARVPYLGICLGAQMLARATDHEVYPADVRELGFNALHPSPEAAHDPLLSVFREGDMVFHWHEDTFDLPDGATTLCTGDEVHLQAFRVGDRAWGTQFHFEIDRAELELWLEAAGEDTLRSWGKSSAQVLEESDRFHPTQEQRAVDLFGRFGEVVLTAATAHPVSPPTTTQR